MISRREILKGVAAGAAVAVAGVPAVAAPAVPAPVAGQVRLIAADVQAVPACIEYLVQVYDGKRWRDDKNWSD